MKSIDELLEEIAHKEWGGRSLMQEARLSGGVFKYHTVALDYPWAKELSFGVEDITYTLRIARKMPHGAVWIPFCDTELSPLPERAHTAKVTEVLIMILGDKQALH
jgi:hypothetical protein